jgi:hypothetical protein
LFDIIGKDRGSREDSNVGFSDSIFFRGFVGGDGVAGPVVGTVGINPIIICGKKDMGVAESPGGDDAIEFEFER